MTVSDSLRRAAPASLSHGLRALARFGFAANGIVYLLMGLLALLAATGQRGGQTATKKQAVQTLQGLPAGPVLLGLMALGLLGYIVWRFTQALADTESQGTDAKGLARRAGYAISGLLYSSLAWFAARLALTGAASADGTTQQTLVARILAWPGGEWVILLAGLGTIGFGGYQLYKAYSGRFHQDVDAADIPAGQRPAVYRLGQIGYSARGIVLAIIGYFLVQAGQQSRAAAVGSTDEAFDLLASMGPAVLGIVALGLMAYGLYMLVQARYPILHLR